MNKKQSLINVLQAIPLFHELSEEQFNTIAEISHIVEISKDDTLFSEGDKEDYLYIVLEGRIAIEISSPTRGRLRIYTAEPMDIVGWSSVTPVVRQRTASTRAVLDSRLVALDAQTLRKLGDEDPELGYIIMRRIANVVAGRLMATRLQLLDLFGQPTKE
jgi:CRP-like cAMP-binding protein